jgi:hypothetical protein
MLLFGRNGMKQGAPIVAPVKYDVFSVSGIVVMVAALKRSDGHEYLFYL